jgi:hypothetical protein
MSDQKQPTYFHGGRPGLRVGGLILPPSVTGERSVQDSTNTPADEQAAIEAVHRRDRVYLATDVRDARMYAAFNVHGTRDRAGDVYRVVPVGEVEPDPDWLGEPGGSVHALRARIVGIVATGVRRGSYLRAVGL